MSQFLVSYCYNYSSARSMYAIRVLHSHGMSVSAPQQDQVFRPVVISKLTYASPASWGFTTSTDCQRIDAVLRRANKSGFWTSAVPSDFPTSENLCSTADDELLLKLLHSRTAHYMRFSHHDPPYNDTAADGVYTPFSSLDTPENI